MDTHDYRGRDPRENRSALFCAVLGLHDRDESGRCRDCGADAESDERSEEAR